jgi:hypothetical protein
MSTPLNRNVALRALFTQASLKLDALLREVIVRNNSIQVSIPGFGIPAKAKYSRQRRLHAGNVNS